MAKKKRKPRPRPEPSAEKKTLTPVKTKKDQAPVIPPPDVYPPLRVTLAHGVAAATSPITLSITFLMVGLIWVALLGFGLQVFPPSMAQALSLPPVSSLFDFGAAASLFGLGSAGFFVFLLAMTVVRAIILSVLAGLLDESLEYGSVSILGLLRGLNGFWGILLFCYLSSGVALLATQILPQILGPQLGQTVSQAAFVGGLYFLGFMPGAAIRLRVPAPEVFLRSMRGARLPGWSRHLMLAVMCYFVSLMFTIVYPDLNRVTANPTVEDWAFVLMSAFMNLVFLAAFVERWKAAEPYVPQQMRSRPGPRSRLR